MTRGRNRSVSDHRLLLEIYIADDGAFAKEIAEGLPVGVTRTRQMLAELADKGDVRIRSVSDINIYALTDSGHERLVSRLREDAERGR